jgi:hypothetical protein
VADGVTPACFLKSSTGSPPGSPASGARSNMPSRMISKTSCSQHSQSNQEYMPSTSSPEGQARHTHRGRLTHHPQPRSADRLLQTAKLLLLGAGPIPGHSLQTATHLTVAQGRDIKAQTRACCSPLSLPHSAQLIELQPDMHGVSSNQMLPRTAHAQYECTAGTVRPHPGIICGDHLPQLGACPCFCQPHQAL